MDFGAVHSVMVTAANRVNISELPNRLSSGGLVIFGDAGYASDEYKRGARAKGLRWMVNDKGDSKHSRYPGLSARRRRCKRKLSSTWTRVEQLFRAAKI